MKKVLLVIFSLFIMMFSTSCTAQKNNSLMDTIIKKDKIVIGIKDNSRPFGFRDENGILQGFDIDLAKKITKNILGDENKIEFVPVTSANRILALTSSSVDMVIATMSITAQRQNVVNFSIPYYVAGETLMTPIDSDITGLTDLRNKKVIVVLGTTAERNLKQLIPSARIKGYKTDIEAYNALITGNGDAFLNDDTILLGLKGDNPNVKILSKRYTQEPYAVAFRQDENSESLRIQVNHILEHMQKNGELNRLKNKWIDF